jgi:hypothetical protein
MTADSGAQRQNARQIVEAESMGDAGHLMAVGDSGRSSPASEILLAQLTSIFNVDARLIPDVTEETSDGVLAAPFIVLRRYSIAVIKEMMEGLYRG